VLRVVVPALGTAYLVFVAMVVFAVRRPIPRPGTGAALADRSIGRRSFAGTMVGGYLAFLVIVLVFHVWLAGESDALVSALWGGAFLCLVAVALFFGSRHLGGRGSTETGG
jgi:hypothetical protein